MRERRALFTAARRSFDVRVSWLEAYLPYYLVPFHVRCGSFIQLKAAVKWRI